MSFARLLFFAAASVLCIGTVLAAVPPFSLTEDGSVFLYPARPGDKPAAVAAMFGIPPEELTSFLAANGITDATRVPTGHVYRIPNPLATRAGRAERRAQALERELSELRARGEALDHDLAAAREIAAAAERRAQRLTRYAWLWRLSIGLAAVLVVGLGFAVASASSAVRMRQRADQYARTLADDLEEKRRRGLGERQEAAKRILDLETQVQALELKREPPARDRRSPVGAR